MCLTQPQWGRSVTQTYLFSTNTSFRKLRQIYPYLAEDISQELALRKEVPEGYRKESQVLSMTTATESNPVIWIHKKLQELFTKPFI